MLRPIAAAAFCVFGATLAFAQPDPVAKRIELMANLGKVTKPVGEMLKGTAPFDLAAVKTALAAYQTTAKQYSALFPEGTENGKDSTASPNIWKNRADFDAKLVAFEKVAAAATTSIIDEASFKSQMGGVLGSCKSCHDDFRVKK